MATKVFITTPASVDWDANGQGVTNLGGMSGGSTKPNNFGAQREKVDAAAPSGVTVLLSVAEPDENYGVIVTPSWDTTAYVPRLDKTTASFKVLFGTIPPDGIGVPTGPGAAASSGGALPTGTYYYVITAEDDGGETTATSEVNATATGSNHTIDVSWTNPSGAVQNRVYRGVTTGVYDGYLVATSSPFSDNGTTALKSGSPPIADTSGGGNIDWLIYRT